MTRQPLQDESPRIAGWRMPRLRASTLLLTVVCGLAGAGCRDGELSTARSAAGAGATAMRVPSLDLIAPPGDEPEIERLRAMASQRLPTLLDIVGLRDGGAPIHVVLAPETHPLARAVPPGIAGYAIAERDLAVLLPERVPRYPYDSLDELLLHELTHVLASRAAGGRPLPRWWSEGLALLASRGWSLEDRSRVMVGAVSGVPDSIGSLQAAFDGGPNQVAAAYALSGALVHDLVRSHGPALVAATLSRVAAGEDFDAAFAAVAGVPLVEEVAGFWRRYRFWYRWLPFLTSGTVLWAGVTGLMILAGIRRRQRDAAIRRRWEEEERLLRLRDMESDTEETVH